jgi:anthranilate phosphoribosyltransferase
MLQQALELVLAGHDLSRAQARVTLEAIFAAPPEGEADPARERLGLPFLDALPLVGLRPGFASRQRAPAPLRAPASCRDMQIAALLGGLAAKGETVEEIVGFAEAMRAAVADIGLNGQPRNSVDTCGTGGSGRRVFNISTAAAFAAAGAGIAVAKHGNRSSTSVCGSADVLEAAGVNLAFPAERLGPCLQETGIAFLFAPLLHPAMRQVMPARRALRVRTIFNLLGPLTNPAGAPTQVVGVASPGVAAKLAAALLALGTRHSFVVYGADGLGEFSTAALNQVLEIHEGQIREFTLDARELGLRRPAPEELRCESQEDAVAGLQRVLAGERGACREIVCLNAAAALTAGGQAADLRQGIAMAEAALDSGAARGKLQALVAYTRG